MGRHKKAAIAAMVALPVSVAVAGAAPLPAGSRYVAMGSSYAAGPGITVSADEPADRCARSADNYAHQLARARGFMLVDVSCSGATTAHILGPWNELPAQIDAVTPDTALVTVTIGGNDVNFVGSLFTSSCAAVEPVHQPAPCRVRPQTNAGSSPPAADEDAWRRAESGLERIAQEVHRRAPSARLIFIDYFKVLPAAKLCAATPLDARSAVQIRQLADRLARLTATIAQRNHAEILRLSKLSRGHEACARDAWVTGFLPQGSTQDFVPYHPTLQGMRAAAAALQRIAS